MENKNRTPWIVLAVVVVGLAGMCVCLAVVALGLIPWRTESGRVPWADWNWPEVMGSRTERIDQVVEVGSQPSLEIDNFAGSVTVRAGEEGSIHVIATKRARTDQNLARTEVAIEERSAGARVQTRKPGSLSNVSVDLEITAPVGTNLELSNGAGTVTVRGLEGSIEISTGAGTVDVSEVRGPARLTTGAGTIRYEGQPEDDCFFETGAGTIDLRLPDTLNAQVELHTGLGSVRTDFDVRGTVSAREVTGTVGNGEGARIEAQTGVGQIEMLRR